MIKVRGRKYLSNDYIIGFLSFRHGDFFIENNSDSSLVYKDSLSVSFGNFDSNRVEIFGSFQIDGEMTRGGDIVTWYLGNAEIEYYITFSIEKGAFVADTIVGNSWCFLWELFEDPESNKALITGKIYE